MTNEEKEMMKVFKVEELEQRLEMKGWTASAKAGTNSSGPYGEASVSYSF